MSDLSTIPMAFPFGVVVLAPQVRRLVTLGALQGVFAATIWPALDLLCMRTSFIPLERQLADFSPQA